MCSPSVAQEGENINTMMNETTQSWCVLFNTFNVFNQVFFVLFTDIVSSDFYKSLRHASLFYVTT